MNIADFKRVRALNSPFDQTEFRRSVADNWVRRQKADYNEDGLLVFRATFASSVKYQFLSSSLKDEADRQFDKDVDFERSNRRTHAESMGIWRTEGGVHQMEHRWPNGTFAELSIHVKPL